VPLTRIAELDSVPLTRSIPFEIVVVPEYE
jgi:hypothetical protein